MKKIIRILHISLLSAALVACGDGATSHPYQPSIQSSTLAYDKQATFYVGVTTLNPGITFSATHCSALQIITSTIANNLAYTCRITESGQLIFSGTDANGKVIATQSFTVPNPQVLIATNLGNFVVELNQAQAPLSTSNFLRYVDEGFYKDTLFHRVISDFVIQAGGFTTGPTLKIPTHDAITLESNNGLSNVRGSLAMARTSEPNSATSQFYINIKDNTNLDYVDTNNPGYAVFGRVISGTSVIDSIAAVQTGAVDAMADVPKAEIFITRAARLQ